MQVLILYSQITFRKLTLSIFLLLIVSVCVFFCEYKNETKAQLYNDTSLERNKKVVFGAWVPFQLQLESMQGTKQVNAIHSLLSQEFDEYYFVMRNFNNSTETKAVEALLKLTDPTDLKIFIILLPPSEGGVSMLVMIGKAGCCILIPLRKNTHRFKVLR